MAIVVLSTIDKYLFIKTLPFADALSPRSI